MFKVKHCLEHNQHNIEVMKSKEVQAKHRNEERHIEALRRIIKPLVDCPFSLHSIYHAIDAFYHKISECKYL